MRTLLISAIVSALVLPLAAQETAQTPASSQPLPALIQPAAACANNYDQNTIYLQNHFFSGFTYVKGTAETPVGFLNSQLLTELETVEAARDLALTSKHDNILGLASLLGGIVVSTILMADAEDPTVGLIVYTGSLAFAIVKQLSAYNKLQQAIWKYNREQAIAGH